MRIIVLSIFSLLTLPTHAEKTTVAVASNFTAAMKAIVEEFEQQTNHQVDVAYGSSGRLFAQIQNGAPFHAFFSADQQKPIALENSNIAVNESRFTYAEGTLALWSPKAGTKSDELLDQLKRGDFNKLAIANPRLAPYGEASIEVLNTLKLLDIVKKKWVQGENIAQTFQFVSTGNADLGFVALAQIVDNANTTPQGSYWIVPADYHQPIKQDAVLLSKGEDNVAAQALLDFVRSPKGKNIIRSKGYTIN